MVQIGIKERRKAVGLSQRELAERLGINQAAVHYWECGVTHPRFHRLKEIADILQCSVDDLMENEQSDKTDG